MSVREVVVITGASAGVGRALARRFARGGADVALLARKSVGLDAAAAEVESFGVSALAIEVDVAEPEAVLAAAARIERELGAIDIWINNAMVSVFGRFVDVSAEELRRVTDVTYHGAVWGTKAALTHMLGRRRGTIVQVGSALSYRAIPLQSAYCAAKFALRGFTDSVRVELLHDGIDIHLTMVQLPAVNTPQFGWSRTYMDRMAQPVPPIYQPEIIAETIHWAAHARRREVYIGWPAVAAIIGTKLAPGLLDRRLARTGFDDQQTAEPVPADYQDNLFVAIDEDRGARGRFTGRAREQAPIAQFFAHWGAAGLRAAVLLIFGLATVGVLALVGAVAWLLA